MAEITIELSEYSTQSRCGFAGSHASQGSLQCLVGSLRRPIGLEVVPRGEVNHGPNPLTEGLPHLQRKLGATVRDDVLGDIM